MLSAFGATGVQLSIASPVRVRLRCPGNQSYERAERGAKSNRLQVFQCDDNNMTDHAEKGKQKAKISHGIPAFTTT